MDMEYQSKKSKVLVTARTHRRYPVSAIMLCIRMSPVYLCIHLRLSIYGYVVHIIYYNIVQNETDISGLVDCR